MMISPECFYEYEIKGKSLEEIYKKITELKEIVKELKYRVEHPDNTKKNFKPSDDTMLWCNRAYLEEAIKGYKEAGGVYELSKEEKEEAAFNAALPLISKITLTIAGFFYGQVKHTVVLHDNKAYFSSEGYLHKSDTFKPVEDDCSMSKKDFLLDLKDLYLCDWKRHYKLDGLVCDGITWEVVIEYVNDTKIKYDGHEAYPYNFERFCELMECDTDFLYDIDIDECVDDET